MSFLKPNVSQNFQKLQSFLLWFQMAYAVWQFVRTAKFFRLPYVMLSSLWHGLDSWIKQRSLIMIKEESEVDKDPLTADVLDKQGMPEHMTITAIADSPNVELSFHPDNPQVYVTTRLRAGHMKYLRTYYLAYRNNRRLPLKFGKDDDLLWPGVHLIRRLSFDDVVNAVLEGKGYETQPATKCFYDYTSNEVLNQNFLRFASIWPLILQARSYDFWSIWKCTQYWASRLVKIMILQVRKRNSRTFWYTFMATVSTRFKCDNFVSGEASLKQVKQLLLATHIRVERKNISTLGPIVCSIEVPRKDIVGPGTSQTILFNLDGENYHGLAQPAMTDGVGSSVHFKSPEDIKVDNWWIADMAYFLQLCDYCNQFKCSPIKKLEGKNGQCSSFSELVHGVKDRKFVLCELKGPQKLFIT
ncbi:hypothetical protein Mapa_005207 [Marchantia paleacea]|nr:hypothetical protein Mapa_005207 [Marchantia paleacea]